MFMTLCATPSISNAEGSSLAWWFLPDAMEDLPLEFEEDDNGYWTELWLRPGVDSEAAPNEVMEQTLGARWVGLNPDKDGKPTRVMLVMADDKIVDFTGEVSKPGSLNDDKIQWIDNTSEPLYAFRRHRRHRNSKKINFGKIILPPLASRTKTLTPWTVEQLSTLLEKLPAGPGVAKITTRDLSVPAQIYDTNGTLLNFRYESNCSDESRAQIENKLAAEVEPRLTCWMQDNPDGSMRLLAALAQRPKISCKAQSPMPADACGMASLPLLNSFFVSDPEIHVAVDRCKGELGQTLLHEILHLAGLKEKDLDSGVVKAESCGQFKATLNYENQNEGFFNDFEIQTRIFIFRKIRDEAVEKWHWREGERDFMLGTICNRMGDKYCSRNYFQKASEENLQGQITLPEGTTVSWGALAQFQFYDAITEDLQRMHELVRYLKRDPNGILLRRIETGTHRLHEFFVAREALEAVKDHKGICSSETDEHIFCEDLLAISKTPWFRNP